MKIFLSEQQQKFSEDKTIHLIQGTILAPPKSLSIVKYPSVNGFYLFYNDETGDEQTDTYHDTIEQAMRQANYEFGVQSNDWEVVSQ